MLCTPFHHLERMEHVSGCVSICDCFLSSAHWLQDLLVSLSVSSSFGLLLLAVTLGSWPIDSFRHSYVKLTLKMDPGPSPTRQPWECRCSPVYLSQLYTPPFFSVFIDLLPTNCTSNVYSVCVVCEVCGVL